jgi:hypothetical protein
VEKSLSNAKLLELFARGLIPGPEESEEAFLERVERALVLESAHWQEASLSTKALFGFAIDWVAVTFSSQNLSWWEGGATFIDAGAHIVLRPAFAKGSCLGTSLEEVLAHEAVHAARMRFDEPKFEEMLAYATSKKRWKRCLGPLFSHRWAVPCLFISAFLAFFYPWLLVVPFGPLLWRHLQFHRCRKKFPLSAMLCMTDEEIRKRELTGKGQLRMSFISALF